MRGSVLVLTFFVLTAAVAASGCAEKQDEPPTPPAQDLPPSERSSRRGSQNRDSPTRDDELPDGKIESPSGFEWRSKALAGGDLFLQFTVDNNGSKDCEGELATAGKGNTAGPLYVSIATGPDGGYNGGWGVSGGGVGNRVVVGDVLDTNDVLVGDGEWSGRFEFDVAPGDRSRFTFMTRDLAALPSDFTGGDAFVFEVSCGGPSNVTDILAGRNVHLFDEATLGGGVIAAAQGNLAASVQGTTTAEFRDPQVETFFAAFPYNVGQFTLDHPSGQDTLLMAVIAPNFMAVTDGPGRYTGTLDKVGAPIFVYTWGAWAGVRPITSLADLEAIPVSAAAA